MCIYFRLDGGQCGLTYQLRQFFCANFGDTPPAISVLSPHFLRIHYFKERGAKLLFFS